MTYFLVVEMVLWKMTRF